MASTLLKMLKNGRRLTRHRHSGSLSRPVSYLHKEGKAFAAFPAVAELLSPNLASTSDRLPILPRVHDLDLSGQILLVPDLRDVAHVAGGSRIVCMI